jgi:hypothetical protein
MKASQLRKLTAAARAARRAELSFERDRRERLTATASSAYRDPHNADLGKPGSRSSPLATRFFFMNT